MQRRTVLGSIATVVLAGCSSNRDEGTPTGPTDVGEAYLRAFYTADSDRVSEFSHSNSSEMATLNPESERIFGPIETDPMINVRETRREGERAFVDYSVTVEVEGGGGQTWTASLELRLDGGDWRVYGGEQVTPPGN